jgi:hypothetical protein
MVTVIGLALCCPSAVRAEEEESSVDASSADKQSKDEPPNDPVDPTDVTTKGVPTHTAKGSKAVSEVEKAVDQVAAKTEGGVPADFTIKFADTYDWIRLTTGEWLKGKLNWMGQKGFGAGATVKFYSEKLDDQTLDWSDIDQVHSPEVNTYGFLGKDEVTGRAVVTKDKVIIETTEGVKTFPRSDLVAIAGGGERERRWWSTSLSLGFSGTAGNSNQATLNGSWDLVRADAKTRAAIGYKGSFGVANSEQTVNQHIGDASVQLFLWKRFFITPVTALFLNDSFRNLKFGTTPAAAGGVHIFNTKKVEWDLEVGLGYQHLRFLSLAAGLTNPASDGFVLVHTYADFNFTDDVELALEWRTSVVYTTIGLTNHIGNADLCISITDVFAFETSFQFLRTENPPPRADGTVPKKNDYQVIVSIAVNIN